LIVACCRLNDGREWASLPLEILAIVPRNFCFDVDLISSKCVQPQGFSPALVHGAHHAASGFYESARIAWNRIFPIRESGEFGQARGFETQVRFGFFAPWRPFEIPSAFSMGARRISTQRTVLFLLEMAGKSDT
jgi:hypothetical protein